MMKKVISLMLAILLSFSFTAELSTGTVHAAVVSAEIVPGTLLEVSSEGTYSSYYCEFVPEESGWYKYYSTGNCSVRGQIFGSTIEEFLAESDNYQKDFLGLDVITGSFKMIHYFEAGKSYILYSGLVNSSGTYSLGIEKVPKATAMTIMDQDVVDMAIGVKKALKLNFTPEDCEQEKITWVSDNPEVVFIDEDGVSHFKSLGTANVTATTENGLTDSITINVVNHPEILLDEEIVFYAGGGKTGTYTFIPKEDGRYAFSIDVSTLLTAKAKVFVEIYDKDYNLVASSTEWSTSEVAYWDMTAEENYYVSYRSSTGDVFGTATAKVTKINNSAPDIIDTTDELWQEGEEIALENVKEIQLDEEKQVNITYENAKSVHKFIPAEAGEYKFTANGNEYVLFGVLNDKFNYINSGNAPFTMKLEAGKTYIITSRISNSADSDLGEYSIEINTLPKPKYGDVDYDGIVCAEDALLVLKHAAKLEKLTDDATLAADVTQDEKVNAEDALEILKYAAILIRDFN